MLDDLRVISNIGFHNESSQDDLDLVVDADKASIHIPKMTLKPTLSVDNLIPETVDSRLWFDEPSKDGEFGQNVNETTSKLRGGVLHQATMNDIRKEKVKNAIFQKNEWLDDHHVLHEVSVEYTFSQLELPDGSLTDLSISSTVILLRFPMIRLCCRPLRTDHSQCNFFRTILNGNEVRCNVQTKPVQIL